MYADRMRIALPFAYANRNASDHANRNAQTDARITCLKAGGQIPAPLPLPLQPSSRNSDGNGGGDA